MLVVFHVDSDKEPFYEATLNSEVIAALTVQCEVFIKNKSYVIWSKTVDIDNTMLHIACESKEVYENRVK